MRGTPKVDLTGVRSGFLVAQRYLGCDKWLCKCDCGEEKVVRGNAIKTGKAKSCGCMSNKLKSESKKKHGALTHDGRPPRLYVIWKTTRAKCVNPKAKGYRLYGAKGITFANEWNDYAAFESWATSNGYEDGLSLLRIDESEGFTPSNCYFGKKSRRDNKPVVKDDEFDPDEIWLPVVGYESLYEVGNKGHVRSILFKNGLTTIPRKKLMHPTDNGHGYMIVSLSNGEKRVNKYVHRIVAEAFIPNPQNLPVVDHVNHDRADNSVGNLRWCTQKENVDHSVSRMRKRRSKPMTNTGERYVSRQKDGRFRVTISKKQICVCDSIEEAVMRRDVELEKEAISVS